MKRFLTILIVIAFSVFLVAGSASAVLTIRLTQGANQVVVADGSPGDMNSAAGAVTVIASVGTFDINVSTGLSKPALGNPPGYITMDLPSVNSSSADGGTLLIELSDDNFTLDGLGSIFGFVASIGGTTGGTVDFYDTYIDHSNALFAKTTNITSQGPFSVSPFSGTATGSVAADPDLFSLTQVVQITRPAGDPHTTSFDALFKSVSIVNIDIKPGSDPNSINCNNGKAVITVAILTTDDFDATTVDHTTVTFEGASETHVNRKTGEPRRHEEDVNGDGDTDLVFHFRLGETDLGCDSVEATLTGETFDGKEIVGTDSVSMVEGRGA